MATQKKSSRTEKKGSLKLEHQPLIQNLREAARRYKGGVTGVSHNTAVCPNTLSNQLNINHESGDLKSCTFVDLLFAFKNDTKFVDFFMRYIFEKSEGTHQQACPADLLQTISRASELITLSTEALADGEISDSEASDLIDLCLHVNSEISELITKLRALRGELCK